MRAKLESEKIKRETQSEKIMSVSLNITISY